MQAMFVLGLEFALSKSDELAPSEITRIGLQDDMTFTGSAAALNRSWEVPLKVCRPKQVTDSIATSAVYRRLDLNIFEDAEIADRGPKSVFGDPTQATWVSLFGSAANAQHCMHVGLGQPAEVPTQTSERIEKALMTLQSIERFACDQHDHVSFAGSNTFLWFAVVTPELPN